MYINMYTCICMYIHTHGTYMYTDTFISPIIYNYFIFPAWLLSACP